MPPAKFAAGFPTFAAFAAADCKAEMAELAALANPEIELAAELAAIAPGVPCDSMPLEQALSNGYPDGEWRVLCGSIHLCGDAVPILTKQN